jgi:DNA-binding CsgD family transcriptional regulator
MAAAGRGRAGRDEALSADVAALLDRLRGQAAGLGAFGPIQQAHRDTFTALTRTAELAQRPEDRRTPADVAGMRAAWDAAAAAWEIAREPHLLAEALVRGAEAATADGDREGAAARLRRAAPVAARLPLGDDAHRLARRLRLGDERAAADGAAPGQGHGSRAPYGLTARELDVLRLVTAGRSNREIADELFISVKTASVHVSNILGKLGVSSRGEAAATAHRIRLFDESPSA